MIPITVGIISITGRNHDIKLKDGVTAWINAHDMQRITTAAVIKGWGKSLI